MQSTQNEPMSFDPVTGQSFSNPVDVNDYRIAYGKLAWLFNPWTGTKRDARDIGDDVLGLAIRIPNKKLQSSKTPSTMIGPYNDVPEIAEWRPTKEQLEKINEGLSKPLKNAVTDNNNKIDPLNTPLPCDITVGYVTTHKGCPLRSLVRRMEELHELSIKK